MANAFYIFDPKELSISGSVQERDDKILPDPVEMETNYPIIDGKEVEVAATSGVDQYVLVTPDDYPTTATQRDKRRGSIRS